MTNKFAKENRAFVPVIVILLIAVVIVIGGTWFVKIRPNSVREAHNMGCTSYIPSRCDELINYKDWVFIEFPQGGDITDQHSAITALISLSIYDPNMKAFFEKFIQLNPQMKLGDASILKYINCWDYTQSLWYVNTSAPVSVKIWACVVDPNGIRGSNKYMPIITWNKLFSEPSPPLKKRDLSPH